MALPPPLQACPGIMSARRWLRRRRRSSGDELSFGPRSAAMRNPEREVHYFRVRVLVAMAFVVLAFTLLGARFAWLQVVKHEAYRTASPCCRWHPTAG